MNTPICDFVENYITRGALRVHMPGHKGLGAYAGDITEITGADSLYAPSGIIRESEKNASDLFGGTTFYSAEGSSQCIRAMLYLVQQYAAENGTNCRILAGRNAHKTFVTAAALLDFKVDWIYPAAEESYLSCTVTPKALREKIREITPAAVYITSPDYLGNVADIGEISRVCREENVLLLVDNAHGAYLRFLPESMHPIDLGADMCCDSAHKTLPVLTGGAYLHIRNGAPEIFTQNAKRAMALFGSTSPSYLILQSLDRVNPYLGGSYRGELAAFTKKVDELRENLRKYGYNFIGNEPLKLTLQTKPYGYTGMEFAAILERKNIVCEFADPDFIVFMVTPETGEEGIFLLSDALLSIPRKAEITVAPPRFSVPERILSIRKAALSPSETVPRTESEGRILSAAEVGCPPAVPILVSGEKIDKAAMAAFAYYGMETCTVVKK